MTATTKLPKSQPTMEAPNAGWGGGAAINYLGPARVLEAEAGRALLETPDAVVWACCATAFFYTPNPEDEVLAVLQNKEAYIIGVLQVRGTVRLSFPGDVSLQAVGGSLRLGATEEVELRGRAIRLFSVDLELTAKWIWQRCTELVQRVQGCLRMEAERVEQKVSGAVCQKAGRIKQEARESIKLQSPSINLN